MTISRISNTVLADTFFVVAFDEFVHEHQTDIYAFTSLCLRMQIDYVANLRGDSFKVLLEQRLTLSIAYITGVSEYLLGTRTEILPSVTRNCFLVIIPRMACNPTFLKRKALNLVLCSQRSLQTAR